MRFTHRQAYTLSMAFLCASQSLYRLPVAGFLRVTRAPQRTHRPRCRRTRYSRADRSVPEEPYQLTWRRNPLKRYVPTAVSRPARTAASTRASASSPIRRGRIAQPGSRAMVPISNSLSPRM